jgi:hypothetical protein
MWRIPTVKIRYQETSSAGREEFMCAIVILIFGVELSEIGIVTVLKTLARKRLVKTEKNYVLCSYTDIWSVQLRETVILTCSYDP